MSGAKMNFPAAKSLSAAPPALAIVAAEAPVRASPSSYPPEFAKRMAGRIKRPLGVLFGLVNFGVNLTRLQPGAVTALRHAHRCQDEFVYVLEGRPTLVTDAGRTELGPGMCAGFRAGSDDAHHIVNTSEADVLLLEIGDCSAGDRVTYPDDDIEACLGEDGKWHFSHKDGTPY